MKCFWRTIAAALILAAAVPAVAEEPSPPEILLRQDAGTWLKTVVSGGNARAVAEAWQRFEISSALAAYNGVKLVEEAPECWAPALHGKRTGGRPGQQVFVRDCLGLDPIAALTSGRYLP